MLTDAYIGTYTQLYLSAVAAKKGFRITQISAYQKGEGNNKSESWRGTSMKLKIDFDTPYFDEQMILSLTTKDLDDYYAEAKEIDRLNLFFVLGASLYRLLKENRSSSAAHCAYLMSYYAFVPLTPPASYELANYYIDIALELNTSSVYQDWKKFIEQGN